MLLAEAVTHHASALSASLQAVYGITVADRPPLELADLVAWLPPGSPLWRAVGGPLAWSDDVQMLAAVEFRLRVLAWQQTEDGRKGRKAPAPPSPPPYAHERDVEKQKITARAAAHAERASRR